MCECPLCGREMTAIETYPGRGELYCGNCDLVIGGNEAKTPEELQAITNNSKKRKKPMGVVTCEADDTDLIPFVRADNDDLNVGYIHVMECSVCGGTYEHVNGSYEFCPRCGAKVLDKMTPTEEICARLDELGVEYDTYDLPNGEHGLSWIDGNNIEWEVVQQGENFRIHALQLVTPEQTIALAVGAGTCHDLAETPANRDKTEFKCSECGYEYSAVAGFDWVYGDEPDFNFCPNCGRRIVG